MTASTAPAKPPAKGYLFTVGTQVVLAEGQERAFAKGDKIKPEDLPADRSALLLELGNIVPQ